MCDNMSQKILENKSLIEYTIGKFFPGRKNDEDIYQVGMIGLWKAIEHEQENNEASFKTYAIKCIKNQIIKELQKENAQKRTLHENDSILYLDCEKVNDNGEVERYAEIIGKEEIPYIALGIREYTAKQSERNKQIIKLIGMGYSLTDIANILNVSKSTIYNEWRMIRKDLKRLC